MRNPRFVIAAWVLGLSATNVCGCAQDAGTDAGSGQDSGRVDSTGSADSSALGGSLGTGASEQGLGGGPIGVGAAGAIHDASSDQGSGASDQDSGNSDGRSGSSGSSWDGAAGKQAGGSAAGFGRRGPMDGGTGGSSNTGGSIGDAASNPLGTDGGTVTCATEALRSGTVYYVCDCQAGAAIGCQAGSDANSGTSSGQAWRSWSKARAQFDTLAAGATVAFCDGGSWTGAGAEPDTYLQNVKCTAANTCDMRNYSTAWGNGIKPKLKLAPG